MTESEIAAIEARANAATPANQLSPPYSYDDTMFNLLSRTDVPILIAEVRRLRGLLLRLALEGAHYTVVNACLFCGEETGPEVHKPDCEAFTPDGELK